MFFCYSHMDSLASIVSDLDRMPKHFRCKASLLAENQVFWLFFVSKITDFSIDAKPVFGARGWIRTTVSGFGPCFAGGRQQLLRVAPFLRRHFLKKGAIFVRLFRQTFPHDSILKMLFAGAPPLTASHLPPERRRFYTESPYRSLKAGCAL